MPLTLGEMKALALDYADVTGDPFIDSALFAKQATIELGKLFDIIVAADELWRSAGVDMPIVAGKKNYPLPADFYKANQVSIADTSGYRRPLTRRPQAEIYLSGPSPSVSGILHISYVPRFLPLIDDMDPVMPVVPDSWVDHAILGLAIRIRVKEESDVSALMALQQQSRAQVTEMCAARDVGENAQIADHYGSHGGGYGIRRYLPRGGISPYDDGAGYCIVGPNLVLG